MGEVRRESLFEKLYGAGKEALDEMKKPIVRKRLKHKFSSAYDDAEEKALEAERKIEEFRSNFENIDINGILEQKARIKKCKELQEQIKEEFVVMFGAEMKVKETEE